MYCEQSPFPCLFQLVLGLHWEIKCSVPGCGNVRKTVIFLQPKFHCFPFNLELRGRWLEAIKNPKEAKSASLDRKRASVLKNKPFSLRVCSDHFTDDAYIGGIRTYYAALKRDAVPTIFPWSATDSDSVQAQSHPQVLFYYKYSPVNHIHTSLLVRQTYIHRHCRL